MKKLLIISLLMFTLISCNHNSNLKFPPPIVKPDNEVMENSAASSDLIASADVKAQDVVLTPAPNQNVNEQTSDTARKIVKEGTISFETSNLEKTRKNILNEVNELKGYLSEENQSNDETENRKEYNLKIRVPSQSFDHLLDTISADAEKIDSKNISTTDITTKFIDVKTRLNNKKLLENRYNQLLTQATKMSDLLAIENKLTEIRSDIESTQGQLNYLSKQVAYSSLDITFYTKTSAEESGNTFAYRLKNAIAGGWNSLQGLFFWLIAAWPFVLIGLVLYFLFSRWRRRRKNLTFKNV